VVHEGAYGGDDEFGLLGEGVELRGLDFARFDIWVVSVWLSLVLL
jgi:hypothetical protein